MPIEEARPKDIEVTVSHNIAEEPAPAEEPAVTDEGMSFYASEDSAVLQDVKAIKKNIYMHSLRTAVISEKCAARLGADPVFTKAIALYHEIGKIKEGDAVENTLSMAKEIELPKRLVDAIKEVISKEDLPFTSKEAGITAITNTILSTYFYLKKTSQNAIAPNRIIDSAMTKYMLNGRLDNAGITLKDCKEIKVFFLETIEGFEKGNR